MKRKSVLVVFCLAMVLVASSAMAFDWTAGAVTVTRIDPSSMPTTIYILIDVNAGSSCPAGGWLTYSGQGATTDIQQQNAKSMYAMLLASLLSGKKLDMFGMNAACTVKNIHIVP